MIVFNAEIYISNWLQELHFVECSNAHTHDVCYTMEKKIKQHAIDNIQRERERD